MRLNSKKTKTLVVSRSRTSAFGYGVLTLGSAELVEIRGLRILGVTFDSMLTFEKHLQKIVSKAAKNLKVVRRAGKLFDYLRALKGCFYAYVLSNLKYCASVWMSSTESHLNLLDSIVRNAERLCERKLCCFGAQKKGLCLVFTL